MTAQPLRIPDEKPDFMLRSVLAIKPGRWRMRNGHTAEIFTRKDLTYQAGGQTKKFPIWKGRCVECNAPMTWNVGGSYSASGNNPFDIVEPAP